MDYKNQLLKLYREVSKHSNYQILPTALKEIIGEDKIEVKSRYEKERLEYINSQIDFGGKTVLDIGGNTGYFSFELLKKGASSVCHYEGNEKHSEFVNIASKALNLTAKVKTINAYYEFDGKGDLYDVVLLFNVLHHVGDDYGTGKNIDEAKLQIIEQLNKMSTISKEMVFQLGFNWMGDVKKPLFSNGTKQEVIEYVRDGVKNHWKIKDIGIATESSNGEIIYKSPNEENIKRIDGMGEFLNRPIFILESINNA